MSDYIEPAESVSEAWLRTLEHVQEVGGYAINVMSTVTNPLAPEDPRIRAAVDAVLDGGNRAGTRVQEVDTVAGTIFPSDLFVDPHLVYSSALEAADKETLDLAASDLYEAYLDMLPILLTDPANARGTYFGRMISWPGKTGGGRNQLADRVTTLRRAHDLNQRKRNLEDIVIGGEGEGLIEDSLAGVQVYAASDRRSRGFPCLVHIDLTVFDGRLSMAAVYRHQYLVTKAYGNLLGLSRLLCFLAQQSGYAVGELVVHATMADTEQGTYTKAGLTELITAARTATA
ncbi:hypothetical protein [Aeromicrobium endophyticum]|uniref:Thymidylate synthase n=1 Tax=Aeromicrobium endophyticum TaxID=2292704 RepID=A0A371P3G8_9ACTN|nr:hypothetical protein [Aeromicrobium endophyticum]REK70472.1 hypothetical protein DX116_15160 [Aeromicrobium endophyticum]